MTDFLASSFEQDASINMKKKDNKNLLIFI